MNEYQKQLRLLVNGNVHSVQFYYTNFETESNYDKLEITHYSGTSVLTGNLGTGSIGMLFPTGFASAQSQQSLWTWDSDYSVSRQSIPRIDQVRVVCRSSAQTTTTHSSLWPNRRHEALLVASGDVIYTSVYQPADTRLTITADVIGSDQANPDLDLYASTTTSMPDDSNFTWRAYHGNPGQGLNGGGEIIDTGTAITPRWVYIGARSYVGRQHVVLRANLQKSPQGVRTITVCHPAVSNIQNHANWPKISSTLRKTALRMFAATHGNVRLATFNMKYWAGFGGDQFCSGIPGCDWCMTATAFLDSCGFQSFAPGPMRIPNAACAGGTAPGDYNFDDFLSLILAHEAGHGLFGLPDEYSQGTGFCAHSFMNGPQNNAYRWCLVKDHCKGAGAVPPGFDCSANGNMWKLATNGVAGTWFYDNPAQGSAEPTAQIWATAYKGYWHLSDGVSFTFN